jgi:superfamily II DNA helicase RecQ
VAGRAELERLVGLLPWSLHPCQVDALRHLADGRDVLASLGTGWGKTLIYILYTMAAGCTTVLLVPLLTLRDDQERELNAWGRRLGWQHDLAAVATVAGVAPASTGGASAAAGAADAEAGGVADAEPPPCVCDACRKNAAREPGKAGRRFKCVHKKPAASVAAAAAATTTAATPATCHETRHTARRPTESAAPVRVRARAATTPTSTSMRRRVARAPPTRADVAALSNKSAEWRVVFEPGGHVYLITPEALAGGSWQAKLRRRALTESAALGLLVVDEAHCCSLRGFAQFRPDYLAIGEAWAAVVEVYESRCGRDGPQPVVLACSGTLPLAVQDEVVRAVALRPSYELVRGPLDRPNVALLVLPAPPARQRNASWGVHAADLVERTWRAAPVWAKSGLTMVYVAYKRHARALRDVLHARGWRATAVHGDLSAAERSRRSDAWAAKRVDIKVSTAADGMGLNRPDVTLQVMLEVPADCMDAWQKWGRTARDFARPGLVVAWVHARYLAERIALTAARGDAVAQLLRLLAALTDPHACVRARLLDELDGRSAGGVCLCRSCLAHRAHSHRPPPPACAADARMTAALQTAARVRASLTTCSLMHEVGVCDATAAALRLLSSAKAAAPADDEWLRVHEVLGPRLRADEGVYATPDAHGQLVARLVGVRALDLELRPNPHAKGSIGYVRPNAWWLEALERSAVSRRPETTVEVALWGGGDVPTSSARSAEHAARALRQLMAADREFDLEMERRREDVESAFFAAGGEWLALDDELREWSQRRDQMSVVSCSSDGERAVPHSPAASPAASRRVPPPADVRQSVRRRAKRAQERPSGVVGEATPPPPSRVHRVTDSGGMRSVEVGSGPDRRRRTITRGGRANEGLFDGVDMED